MTTQSVQSTVIEAARAYIRTLFAGEASGHDHFHSERVWRNARAISREEGGDAFLIELAALLHDVDDTKLFHTENYANARTFMAREGVASNTAETVCGIIAEVSFKGKDSVTPATLEGKIVQDADRLDAIGAIGIARAFAFGGSRGRPLYDPEEAPRAGMTAEEYRAHAGTTVNHFYEKLLLLKDLMNTQTARQLAAARHECMEKFLREFLAEWEGLEPTQS